MKNRIEVEGFLASKPEPRFLPSGTRVANARLGESYTVKREPGKEDPHTNWHALSFYGDLAVAAATLEKGSHLFVVGSYECREWTGSDQRKRSAWELNVSSFHEIAPRASRPGSVAIASGKPEEEQDASWPA